MGTELVRVNGRVVEDADAAPAIKEIFRLYATGRFSLRSLADYELKVASGDNAGRRRVVEDFAAGDEANAGNLLDQVKQAARQTYRSAARLREVGAKYDTPVNYPATGLAGVEFVDGHPPREVAERAARQAVAMLDGIDAPAGEMPVVMGPGGGGILFHEACGHGLEADLVQKGSSIYRGKLGQTLASPLVTGVDEATVPNAWGSFSFDDEGWPAQRTVLIDAGVLQSYLYDRLRAERDGASSTSLDGGRLRTHRRRTTGRPRSGPTDHRWAGHWPTHLHDSRTPSGA